MPISDINFAVMAINNQYLPIADMFFKNSFCDDQILYGLKIMQTEFFNVFLYFQNVFNFQITRLQGYHET